MNSLLRALARLLVTIGVTTSLCSACGNDDSINVDAVMSYYDEMVIFQSVACLLQIQCTDLTSVCEKEIDTRLQNETRSMTDTQLVLCLLSVRTLECPDVWPPTETSECATTAVE